MLRQALRIPNSLSLVRGSRGLATQAIHELGSTDTYFDKLKIDKAQHPERKEFTYFMFASHRFVYASAVRAAVVKFVSSMSASKDVLALASAEFDIGAVDVGQSLTVKWRGKPVFIRRRSDSEIATAESVGVGELRDPQTDGERVQNAEWLIALGICTHLGCVPIAGAGEFGGWFCPCHGSHYDVSGRIRKGPAPYNLEIPPYKFLEDTKILVG